VLWLVLVGVIHEISLPAVGVRITLHAIADRRGTYSARWKIALRRLLSLAQPCVDLRSSISIIVRLLARDAVTAERRPAMFKSNYYADLPLDQWIALTPPELVNAHLKLDPQLMKALRKQKVPVVPRSQPKQRPAQQRRQAFAFRGTVGRKGQQGQTHRSLHMDDAPETGLVQFVDRSSHAPRLRTSPSLRSGLGLAHTRKLTVEEASCESERTVVEEKSSRRR